MTKSAVLLQHKKKQINKAITDQKNVIEHLADTISDKNTTLQYQNQRQQNVLEENQVLSQQIEDIFKHLQTIDKELAVCETGMQDLDKVFTIMSNLDEINRTSVECIKQLQEQEKQLKKETLEQQRIHDENMSKLCLEVPSDQEIEELTVELENYKQEFQKLSEKNIEQAKIKVELEKELLQLNNDVVKIRNKKTRFEAFLSKKSVMHEQKINEVNKLMNINFQIIKLKEEKNVLKQDVAIKEALVAGKELQLANTYGSTARKLKVENYVDNIESRKKVIKHVIC